MPLTKFVSNVEDLSDDGGYKFRFKCDRCSDGFESQYSGSKANLLKTAMDVFTVFNPLGGFGGRASQGLDRGLRGKERDAAYERAVNEAMSFFKKCSTCGHWVCPENCWNDKRGMCDRCAPESDQAAAREANRREIEKAVKSVTEVETGGVAVINCPVCNARTGSGKYCQGCGASLVAKAACKNCKQPLELGVKFCGDCGAKV